MPGRTRILPFISASTLRMRFDVGEGALVVEAVGHGEIFGVVGDGDVFEAAGEGGFGHLADGVAAVGGVGVHVEVAADVGEGDEVGEGVAGGGFELAGVFAELGWDVVEVEGVVDVGSSVAAATMVLSSTRSRAYSFRVRPRLMARWRRATLCILSR